jgi:trehalose synthase
MQSPATNARSLRDYEAYVSQARAERLRSRGAELGDRRVVHVNSTAAGGGVAELLRSLVPLMNDVGVPTDWLVMEADEQFYDVTKAIHNGLQGDGSAITEEMWESYRSWNDRNATALEGPVDVVVLHDPQPLGSVGPLRDRFPDATLVWRCHIDLTDANPSVLEVLTASIDRVDRAVFSREAYGAGVTDVPKRVVHPAIDPLTDKNRETSAEAVDEPGGELPGELFEEDVPVVTQVSRFDPWKDPIGVLRAHRLLVESFPRAHLILAGGMADDDPEGQAVFDQVVTEASADSNVTLLTDLSDTAVNLLQSSADVVLQKSLREGFALTVSEALWKRTPVVGSNVGGIPLQVVDGDCGFLVEPEDIEGTADRVAELLDDPARRHRMGEAGRDRVGERFLLPRLLLDYLDLLAEL